MREFRIYISEGCEEGERVSAAKIISEIHDSMCMCGSPLDCDLDDVKATLLEAAISLLSDGEWSQNFEDGWIKVEPINSPAVDVEKALYEALKDLLNWNPEFHPHEYRLARDKANAAMALYESKLSGKQ